MNFIEYTNDLIEKYGQNKRVLVVGAGYEVGYVENATVIQNDGDVDLVDWITGLRNSESMDELFDVVILSRVLEHFPIRSLDWYLYNIYTIMKKDAELICIVPDMIETAQAIENEFSKATPNMFKVNRLTYELLSEGDHVWDRHAAWTSENSVKYYLQMEGLFKVESIEKTRLDSSIVPREIEVIARRI